MTTKTKEKVDVVDMHKIHRTDETWQMYQVFHTDGTMVKQSMVLPHELLEQLIKRGQEVLSEE